MISECSSVSKLRVYLSTKDLGLTMVIDSTDGGEARPKMALCQWSTKISALGTIKSARSPELSSPPGNSLSICGLAMQAVVFAAVAFTWIWRVPIENARLEWGTLSWPAVALENLMYWYNLVGFHAFDNGVFAVGQGVLFVLAWRRVKGRENAVDREQEPLLGGSEDRATIRPIL
jgi:hypothetical protein